METFDTPRLRLRPLGADDEALYCDLYTDPRVMVHISPPLALGAARDGFEKSRLRNTEPDGSRLHWAVLDRASGVPLGLLALLREPGDPGNAELGIMLLPVGQGRGFARELNDAILARAFAAGGWGLTRVWARHAPGNAAAAAALAASGFEPGPDAGDDATCSITRDRWRSLAPGTGTG